MFCFGKMPKILVTLLNSTFHEYWMNLCVASLVGLKTFFLSNDQKCSNGIVQNSGPNFKSHSRNNSPWFYFLLVLYKNKAL